MDILNIFNASVLSMLHLHLIFAHVEATESWKWNFEYRRMTNKKINKRLKVTHIFINDKEIKHISAACLQDLLC